MYVCRLIHGQRRFFMLLRQQAPLALCSPAIAARDPIFSYHPVARNNQRYWIASTGLGNRTSSPGIAHSLGNFAVGACATIGNASQFFPDTPLESSGLNIQRQIEMRLLTIQVFQDSIDP